MLIKVQHILGALVCVLVLASSAAAQTPVPGAPSPPQRGPSSPARPFVVQRAQPLSELEQILRADNKVAELYGGAGLQLRVAVQHDKNKTGITAELHDDADDVYYVLEGTATLTLGGRLDAPRELEPGEWRSPQIIGGQTFALAKGDLVVVPRGTPHQRSTAGQDFSMLLIKVFAAPVRAQPAKSDPTIKQPKP